MRLLFLTAHYPPHTRGGAEISTHLLASALVRRGHEVRVITAGRAGRREVDGVPVVTLAVPWTAKPLFERRHAQRLKRTVDAGIQAALADEGQPWRSDEWIVHAHDFRSGLVLSELTYPHRALTVRDYAFICGSPNNLLANGNPCPGCERLLTVFKNRAVVEAPAWRRPFRVWQYWYNISYRRQVLYKLPNQVYISHAQRREVEQQARLQPSLSRVIYNPVPDSYFTTAAVRPVGREILYVGTIDSYKGVGLLLEAFRQVARTHSAVHLTLVGDGPLRKAYERQVERWGLSYRVSFAGRVAWERLRSVYDRAYIVVAPALWTEPFGRSVAEAMARGRLVIASDRGGPAEMIMPGKTGWLFPTGSVQGLVEAIGAVLGAGLMEQREVARAARAWATDHLRADHIAAQYEGFYTHLTTPGV